ncbi:MAG: PilW family protein [Oceanospirillaceae bacterium]|nr:PilW family protein [Oceanospirillaceae bacterium]MCP5334570.1 PilW family protein [Oceanospirillaceae bacterium]MCP5351396.1 PilW family protein [Oceanospirillaceae bacterium]
MKKHSGFTLVEIMIALFLGSLLLAGLMNIFITTNRSMWLTDGLSHTQEAGRFSMDYISRYVRMGGYMDKNSNDSSGTALYSKNCGVGACAANDVAGINGDRLAVFYYAPASSTTRNCQGGIVAAGTSVVNVFWVNANRELVCGVFDPTANAWSAVAAPLITDVESLQYLVGTRSGNDIIYQPIDKIAANNWDNISSIRIAVLIASQAQDVNGKKANQAMDEKQRTYALLDQKIDTYNDGLIRQVFSTTIDLINQSI